MQIDLNSDLGESFGAWVMGDDAAMLGVVTSANIACGGHAGDAQTMFATLREAAARGVSIGAHPGYADRAGFGRRVIPMQPRRNRSQCWRRRVGALQGCRGTGPGRRLAMSKPHGALANLAADRRDVADAIVRAVAALPGRLAILAISGTELELAARALACPVYSEVFADRGYLPNGRLVPRGQPGAMIDDPELAADRMIGLLRSGAMPVVGGAPIMLAAHSICVHGDSPGALVMARHMRQRLTAEGIELRPFLARR